MREGSPDRHPVESEAYPRDIECTTPLGPVRLTLLDPDTVSTFVEGHRVMFTSNNGKIVTEVLPPLEPDTAPLSEDHPRIRLARTHADQILHDTHMTVSGTAADFASIGLDRQALEKDAAWQAFLERRRAGLDEGDA